MKNKIMTLATVFLSGIGSVAASPGHDEGTTTGMMMTDSSWMHSGADMMGYNMWGMGWYGLLMGLAFWTLVALAIIYLYQQITENNGETQNE